MTATAKSPTLGVFIGRFQFFHYGHLDAIRQARKKVDYLVILVGSANQPRSYFNPFTFEERQETIERAVDEAGITQFTVFPLEDILYNDIGWARQVQDRAADALDFFELPAETEISLVGFKKDGTSYYLNMFPQWGETSVRNNTGYSATPIRESYFLDEHFTEESKLPRATLDFLQSFATTPDYDTIYDEYVFVRDYQLPYKHLKWPPVFVTTDAVVIQSGYVLMVKRDEFPGKGLWALPGGFLEPGCRIEDNIFKELIEETKISYDVPETVIRSRLERIEYFDAVHRSSRGRTITHCGLILLKTPPKKGGGRTSLPRVRPSKESREADWFPLNGPGALDPSQVFEDHYSIIRKMTADL